MLMISHQHSFVLALVRISVDLYLLSRNLNHPLLIRQTSVAESEALAGLSAVWGKSARLDLPHRMFRVRRTPSHIGVAKIG